MQVHDDQLGIPVDDPGRLPPPPDAAYVEAMGQEATERQRREYERMTKCTCAEPPQMVVNLATGELVEDTSARGRVVLHGIGCPRAK